MQLLVQLACVLLLVDLALLNLGLLEEMEHLALLMQHLALLLALSMPGMRARGLVGIGALGMGMPGEWGLVGIGALGMGMPGR